MLFMNVIKRFLRKADIIGKIKGQPNVFRQLSPYRWECPNCTEKAWKNDPYSATVSVKYLWDEKFHKYKFYFGCRNCNYVTPAYDTAKEAYNMYTEDIISTEHKVAESMF